MSVNKHEEIKSVLNLIRSGAKAPKYSRQLSGWRMFVYRLLNAALLLIIIFILYKLFN